MAEVVVLADEGLELAESSRACSTAMGSRTRSWPCVAWLLSVMMQRFLRRLMRPSATTRTSLPRIRDGKVQAAGVLIGAVMKATRGKADAARVRELIMERLS